MANYRDNSNIGWKILSLFLALVLVAGIITGMVFWRKENIVFNPVKQEEADEKPEDNGGAVVGENTGNGTNYINLEKSTPVKIYKLAEPEATRENGRYVWSAVADTSSYAVYVDGKLMDTYQHEAGKTYEFTPKFTELKTYKVEIYAIGGGYTTIDSMPCTVLQETKQLSTPDFTLAYSETSYSNTGTIDITITNHPQYASGYSYTVGGVTKVLQGAEQINYSHLPSSVGAFAIRVYALGGAFDEDGVYYLDSQVQGGSAAYTITQLACPNQESINLSQDGKLSWTAIGNAIGYEIEISIDGGEYGEVIVVNNKSSYILENFSQYKGKQIKILLRAPRVTVQKSFLPKRLKKSGIYD